MRWAAQLPIRRTLISGKTLYDPHEVLEAQLVPRSTDIPFGEMA